MLLSSLLPGASLLLPWLHGYSFQGSQLHQLSADEKRDLFERPGVVERTSFGHIFQFQDWLRTKKHQKTMAPNEQVLHVLWNAGMPKFQRDL